MGRPRKPRCIQFTPSVTYFKPAGVPLRTLEEIDLSVEELEALRLKDVQGLVQDECAQQMDLSQSTFQRTLASARKKIATALVSGSAIRIESEHRQEVITDEEHHQEFTDDPNHRRRRRGQLRH